MIEAAKPVVYEGIFGRKAGKMIWRGAVRNRTAENRAVALLPKQNRRAAQPRAPAFTTNN